MTLEQTVWMSNREVKFSSYPITLDDARHEFEKAVSFGMCFRKAKIRILNPDGTIYKKAKLKTQ